MEKENNSFHPQNLLLYSYFPSLPTCTSLLLASDLLYSLFFLSLLNNCYLICIVYIYYLFNLLFEFILTLVTVSDDNNALHSSVCIYTMSMRESVGDRSEAHRCICPWLQYITPLSRGLL